MSTEAQPTCITCGQAVGLPARLNHLPSGEPCPLCHNRLLDSLPPLLPFRGRASPKPEQVKAVSANKASRSESGVAVPKPFQRLQGGKYSGLAHELPDQPA